MKKQLIAAVAVLSIAGLYARNNNTNHMNNEQNQTDHMNKRQAKKHAKHMKHNKQSNKFFAVKIDNTQSTKPSVVTLNYADSPRYMVKTVGAGQTMSLSQKGYTVNNIGVRQGRGPASTIEKDGNFAGNFTIKIMSNKTPSGFGVQIAKSNQGLFGWFRK